MANDRDRETAGISAWEWAFAFVGFALVTASIAFLAHEALTSGNAPPDIEVRTLSILPSGQGYLVTISAINHGDTTAAGVLVRGELRNGTAIVETSEMQFQYVPARSRREGGLFFAHDPRTLQTAITARGYERP
jgi:uncharacterized protein (TIGR02588 family)